MEIKMFNKAKELVKKIEKLTKHIECIENALESNDFKPLIFSGYPEYSSFEIDVDLNREMHEFFLSKFKPELEKLKQELEEL
jgi:hypothetical protein